MRDEILALEREVRVMEPGKDERARMRETVVAFTESFLEQLPDLPTWRDGDGKGLNQLPIDESPKDMDHLLKVLDEQVFKPGINAASGGHLGYIPVTTLYPAALGDFLASVAHKYVGIYYPSPGGVRMEHQLLRWMANLIGLPETAGGNLTSSGSMSHLIGVGAAREAKGLRSRDYERAVVYLSEETHYCVAKALRVAGMGEAILRRIPVNHRGAMEVAAVEIAVKEDLERDLIPWMLCANAGTVNTGIVDPLDDLADVAETFDLWYQVDGAYGGFFMLCEEGQRRLKGFERADLVVLDPHKGLFMPAGLGAVLARDREWIRKAHTYDAAYLPEEHCEPDELSPAEMSPELTKHFRSLRLWLSIQYLGVAPFRAALREKLLLAKYAHQELSEIEGVVMGPEPELSVVTFRYQPEKGDGESFNKKLVEYVLKDGKVFLSPTRVKGVFTIRIAVLTYRTHLETVDYAINMIKTGIQTGISEAWGVQEEALK